MNNTNIDKTPILAEYHTNSFRKNPIITIYLATSIGMSFMLISIYLNAGTILSMLFLFAGILLVLGFQTGKAVFILTEEGMSEEVKPFLYRFSKKVTTRFFHFNDIESYLLDSDLNRSGKEIRVLKIKLKKAPYKIWLNDEASPALFDLFSKAFVNAIELYNNHLPIQHEAKFEKIEPDAMYSLKETPVKRKKSFYDTFFSKILTIFFILFSLLLIILNFYGFMKGSQLFKLIYIIIPGTIYLFHRSFRKKDNKN